MCSEEHPDASRIVPPEGLAIPAVPAPETLCHGHGQKSEDPSPRTPLQIKRPFAAVANPDPKILRRAAPPDPKVLCCGCRSRPGGPSPRRLSGPEGPSLRLQVQTRRSFAAPLLQTRRSFVAVADPGPKTLHCDASPDPKTLCCVRPSKSENPSLRNKKLRT
jgi:hypothetical protein